MPVIKLFSINGIPLAVSPFYFLLLVFLSAGSPNFLYGLVFAVIITVSLLVHELGHAKMAEHYGLKPDITLTAFGGVTSYQPVALSAKKQLFISAAGPAAGFLLALLSLGAMLGTEAFIPDFSENYFGYAFILQNFVLINVVWTIFNLFPVIPLDGGHIMMHFARHKFGSGLKVIRRVALISTVFCAVLLAVGMILGSVIMIVLAAMFLVQNGMNYRQLTKTG